MRVTRVLTVATVVGMVVTGAGGSGASASTGGTQPSTEGIIVWTNRTPSGAEHLLIARADGTRQRVLTPAVADADDLNAQVSPDGSWVAYEHDLPDTASIHPSVPTGPGTTWSTSDASTRAWWRPSRPGSRSPGSRSRW